jgi:hypothetical protein
MHVLVVQDFEMLEAILEYTLQQRMYLDTTEHPILVTEPAFNTAAHRDKYAATSTSLVVVVTCLPDVVPLLLLLVCLTLFHCCCYCCCCYWCCCCYCTD